MGAGRPQLGAAALGEGHPLDEPTVGVIGSIMRLVDLWLDEDGLPDHMQAALR
jgi:hypothetical protein